MNPPKSIFDRIGPSVSCQPTQFTPVLARQPSLSVLRGSSFDSSRDRDGNTLPPGWQSVQSSTGFIYYRTPNGICTRNGPGVLRLRRRPTLSSELIEIIVDLVADEIYDPPQKLGGWDLTPLLACCLASKSFLHPARRRLYRSVTVFINESCQPSPTKLTLTIKSSPHLASLVRSITLMRGNFLSPAGVEFANAASTILRSCRSLQDLWLDGFSSKDQFNSHLSDLRDTEVSRLVYAVAANSAALRSLSLSNISLARYDAFIPLAGFLWEQKSLESINIKSVRWPKREDVAWGEPAPKALRLRTLRWSLDATDGDATFAFKFITNSSKHSLQSMVLHSGYGSEPLDFSRLVNLASLEWHIEWPTRDLRPDFTNSHLRYLEHIKSIRELIIVFYTADGPDANFPLTTAIAHLDFIPRELKFLSLPFIQPSIPMLFIFKNLCPGLVQLEIAGPERADWDLWTPEMVDGLEWVCKRRRVELVGEWEHYRIDSGDSECLSDAGSSIGGHG